MCSHSCKHAFVIRHTGNIRRDSTRGRQNKREKESEGEDVPLYVAVDFLKSQFAKFSISEYFEKLCHCAWVSSERERKGERDRYIYGGRGTVVRGEGCSPCRGACVRVCPLFGASLCCAQVSSPCPIADSPSTWNFTVFYSFTSIVFLTFCPRVSIEFTNYILLRIANRIVPRGKCA